MNDQKLFKEFCLVSKSGVCLLDMQQVADAARRIGCNLLADVVTADLEQNKVTTGNYYPLIAWINGAQA
jgi:hypothetical protein